MALDDARRVKPEAGELRSPWWSQAGPVDDHDRGKAAHAIGLMPGAKQAGRIPTEDEEHLILRMLAMELAQRVHRVGRSAARDLDVRHLETRLVLNRECGHHQPVLRRSQSCPSMRRLRARHKEDAIQVRALRRRLCRRQVPFVDGIERSAENADPHGWYSNSTPEMRTVSPGSTPAASSATLTPSLSRFDWN